MTHSITQKWSSGLVNAGLYAGYKFPLIRATSSRQALVLLYHGIPAVGDGSCIDGNAFARQIAFLKKSYHCIAQDQLGQGRRPFDKIQVVLTFDDGLRNNAEVVAPILRHYQVPAVFFVCSRHAVPRRYLWFAYLQALEKHFPGEEFRFRGERIDMSQEHRRESIQRLNDFLLQLTPHPTAMYQAIEEDLPPLETFINQQTLDNYYTGMTAEQIGELAADPLFSIGVHTVDHPFLSRCNTQEAFHQIQSNRSWLEEICGKPCNTVAYPSGDYNTDVLQHICQLDFVYGYAVTPHVKSHMSMEIPRVGIYSTSVHALGFKVQWGRAMRDLGIRMG